MRKLNCDQGSPEWFEARVGVPSASNFDRLLTGSLRPSAQADKYFYELTAEWIHGEKKFLKPTYWMDRGVEMEPTARAHYEFLADVDVEQVGLVYKDNKKLVSCSPDGLVAKKGLEIKCPSPHVHIAYLLQEVCPPEYLAQVQGSMWVSGLKQWDFMSYHPDYDELIVTVDADPKWQAAFDDILQPFMTRVRDERKNPKVIALRERRIQQQAVMEGIAA